MNPGSAQQLVSAERRAVRATFQSFEFGGGEFTQTVLDARRAQSGSRGHRSWGLPRSGALGRARLLQLANIARRNQPVTSHDLTDQSVKRAARIARFP